VIESGFGEGLYLAGTHFTEQSGACPQWGNTHTDADFYPGGPGGFGAPPKFALLFHRARQSLA